MSSDTVFGDVNLTDEIPKVMSVREVFETYGFRYARESLDRQVHEVSIEVVAERRRQIAKWPNEEGSMPDGTGGGGYETFEKIARHSCERAQRESRLTHAHVFEEECAEVLAETDPARLRVELVQVMAVCAKWIADIDSRKP